MKRRNSISRLLPILWQSIFASNIFFKLTPPTIVASLGSQMLMDPHPRQQHDADQHVVSNSLLQELDKFLTFGQVKTEYFTRCSIVNCAYKVTR